MTIKSLLLGSAAVLVAVSGARAADAIVVEPEPVEYVRVCDAYGSGWFYIPGTETCLKFDGDVRVQYTGYHVHGDDYYIPGFSDGYTDDETSLHDADYRARLNVRANNETEYGMLSSRFRLVGAGSANQDTGLEGGHNDVLSLTEGPTSAAVVVDKAFISLGGFTVGWDEDYWTQAGGYGFYQARFDGVYGYNTALFAQYTYAANGFAFTVGAQDGTRSGEAGSPDVYGGVTYSSGGFYAAGIYIYDSSAGAGAWKVRADYDFGNGWKFGGLYAADDGDTDYVKGHAWFVTGQWQMTETMLLFAGYGNYADGFNNNEEWAQYDVGCDTTAGQFGCDGSQNYTTVGLAWNVVPGLLIQPEYNWVQYTGDDLSEVADDEAAAGSNFGRFSLRIVRSF
jgi:hypothetical protein